MTDITFEYIGPTTYGNYSTWHLISTMEHQTAGIAYANPRRRHHLSTPLTARERNCGRTTLPINRIGKWRFKPVKFH